MLIIQKGIKSLHLARAGLLLACLVSTVGGQRAAWPTLPFSAGEELVYQTEFNKALLRGVDVAEFHFRVNADPAGSENGAARDAARLRLVADAVSKGFFAKLFRINIHEHIESTIANDIFTPLRTTRLDEQGKRVRIAEAGFDHQARKVTWTERDPNHPQPPTTTTIDFQEPIQDLLSAIYFLRTKKLTVGESLTVPLTDSGRFVNVQVAVVERKRMNSALGRVTAVRIQPAIFGENALVKRAGTLSIWITDDNRRIPIKAQLKVEIGTFDIKLKRVIDSSLNQAR